MTSQPVMNGMLYRRLGRKFGTVKVSRAGEARIATARRNPLTGQSRDDVRRATRAELRAIVAEEAAKENIEVGYGKVEDARNR